MACDGGFFFRFRHGRRGRAGGAQASGVACLHAVGVGLARRRRGVRVAGRARPRVVFDDDEVLGVGAAQDLVPGYGVV